MRNLLKWSAPIVVAMLLSLPTATLAKGKWKLVQSAEKDFSISMPAGAKPVEKHVKNVTIHAFTVDEDGTNYSITHVAGIQAGPSAVDSIANGAITEFKRQAEAKNVALTIDKTEEAKGEGWVGKKTFISVGSASLQMIAALSENKYVGYCLITASKKGATQNPEFFNSFKVDTKRTNELYANKAGNIGEMIGRILGIMLGGGVVFFIADKIKKKNH